MYQILIGGIDKQTNKKTSDLTSDMASQASKPIRRITVNRGSGRRR